MELEEDLMNTNRCADNLCDENGNGNCFLHPVARLDMIPVQCTNVITSCSFTTGLADH